MLQKLICASEMRTRRAHKKPISEWEVVDALEGIHATLVQCGLEPAADKFLTPGERVQGLVDKVQYLVDKAQELGDKASTASSDWSEEVSRPTDSQRLTVPEWEALVLYQALNEFDTQLAEQLQPIGNNTSVEAEDTHSEERLGLPGDKRSPFYYKNGKIECGDCSPDQKRRVRQANKKLEGITKERNLLYHSTGAELKLSQCLKTMKEVLISLHGIGREEHESGIGEAAPSWPFLERLCSDFDGMCAGSSSTVLVQVSLQLSGQGMRVPFRVTNYLWGVKTCSGGCAARSWNRLQPDLC